MTARTIRIGNAGGYWGDDLGALERQLLGGPLDYVSIDFLAEITMSIMQKQRAKDPTSGYARDFVGQMKKLLPEVVRRGVRIITNAGGINPVGCAQAILALAKEQGLSLKVGIVHGDDMMPVIAELSRKGVAMRNMDNDAPFASVQERVTSANAYFGAWPVVEALRQGAQIIVTGRVTDTGITLAPMIHEFGWGAGDWDRLACGIVAGHIIECGAQATGGNFTNWKSVQSFTSVGYPIVEVHEDGTFVVTKHAGSGGRVSIGTVKEQLVYEMGDPRGYITPDVVADFGTIHLDADGQDRVRVSGIKGRRATDLLKVSMSYSAGHKASGGIFVSGPDAIEKARAFGRIFWERLGGGAEATLTELVGYDSSFPDAGPERPDPWEVLLRLGVRDSDFRKVEAFSKLLPSLILSGPPGATVTGGRPPVSEVMAYWPCLIPRELIRAVVETHGTDGSKVQADLDWPILAPERALYAIPQGPTTYPTTGPMTEVLLSTLVFGRSGDKGDTANIGVLARSPEVYAWMVEYLTTERLKDYFKTLCHGDIVRYEVPNLLGLNFLLHHSLGGGGTLSLHVDAQGKTFFPTLSRMRVKVPSDLLSTVSVGAP